MLYKILFVCICFYTSFQTSAKVIYTPADSVKVMDLLNGARGLPVETNKVIYFAKKLSETPYVGGTLERGEEESLVVNLLELDCTTFVETVLALSVTVKNENSEFKEYLDALKEIRYRSGKIDGYNSRLHYFSDWIIDNELKGLVKEVSCDLSVNKIRLNLFYMSAHSDKYPALKNCPENIWKITEQERILNKNTVCYIPKDSLAASANRIADGNIIALTTNIKGLDISHVGFAVWDKGQLCLLHASSIHKKVVMEPLLKYIKDKKAQTGIRVISIIGY